MQLPSTRGWWSRLNPGLPNGTTGPIEDSSEQKAQQMLAAIQQAKLDIVSAQSYFDSVSDPELVDQAITLKDEAEKRYISLLEQAKLDGIRAFEPVHGVMQQ